MAAPDVLQTERMDKTIRKYTSFDEMKADEYRYWQSRPVQERMDAVEEMIEIVYALKSWKLEPDLPRLQRPFVRLPCRHFHEAETGAKSRVCVSLTCNT